MKTKLTFKSIIDGIGSYLLYYLWTALLIYAASLMIGYIRLNYLQCLGGLIILRQIMIIFTVPSDKHLRKAENSDTFAADFAVWVNKNYTRIVGLNFWEDNDDSENRFTTTELIKKYKKLIGIIG